MDEQAGSTETVNVQFYVEALEAELAAAQSRVVRLTALSRELQSEVARLRRVNEALQARRKRRTPVASFTFTIPDADVPRIEAALLDQFPGAANARQGLIALIKQSVRMHEHQAGSERPVRSDPGPAGCSRRGSAGHRDLVMTRAELPFLVFRRVAKPFHLAIALATGTLAYVDLFQNSTSLSVTLWGDIVGVVALISLPPCSSWAGGSAGTRLGR